MITLEALENTNEQEVFDKIVTHLREQGEPSIDSSNECVYRGETDGKVTMCAAGCLFLDGEYKAEYERKDWNTLIYDYNLNPKFSSLIDDMQDIHDRSSVSKWEERFKELATDRVLIYTPVK